MGTHAQAATLPCRDGSLAAVRPIAQHTVQTWEDRSRTPPTSRQPTTAPLGRCRGKEGGEGKWEGLCTSAASRGSILSCHSATRLLSCVSMAYCSEPRVNASCTHVHGVGVGVTCAESAARRRPHMWGSARGQATMLAHTHTHTHTHTVWHRGTPHGQTAAHKLVPPPPPRVIPNGSPVAAHLCRAQSNDPPPHPRFHKQRWRWQWQRQRWQGTVVQCGACTGPRR
jgi:hypothetical protein